MLGNHPDSEIGFGFRAVLHASQVAHCIHDGAEKVGFVDVGLALQDGGGAFQPQPGINAGRRQWSAAAGRILVELHEHQVPQFDEPFTVAVRMAAAELGFRATGSFTAEQRGEFIGRRHLVSLGMLADALLGAAVVMQLGAGPGGAFQPGRPPPVILVTVAVDALRRHTDVVAPQLVGLIVVKVNRHVEAVGFQAEQIGAQFPGEGHCILLEIVSDAEVAQHLKESEVLVVADLVDVGGAEGFLAAGEATARRGLLAHEEGFEGHHAGGREEQRRVAGGDERRGRHMEMAAFLEKLDVGVADAVAFHIRLRLPLI